MALPKRERLKLFFIVCMTLAYYTSYFIHRTRIRNTRYTVGHLVPYTYAGKVVIFVNYGEAMSSSYDRLHRPRYTYHKPGSSVKRQSVAVAKVDVDFLYS